MLAELFEQLTQLVESIVLTFGLPGIGLIAIAENLFPPTPSEILYPLAGKMAYDGALSLPAVVVIGVLGTCLASSLWYVLGWRLGEERTRRWVERYGTLRLGRLRWELFSVEAFDKALELFRTRGGMIVVVARVLPYVHSVVSIPAGVVKMPYGWFLLYTAVGSTLWILPFTLLGYTLGSGWREVLSLIDTYQTVILAALGALIAYWIIRRVLRRRASSAVYRKAPKL